MRFNPRVLGDSEQTVQPIIIGGGYISNTKALDLAYERGINYFFWAPVFPTYRQTTKWLKQKFKTDRDKMLLGTCTYFWKLPGSIERTVDRHLRWLGADYIDYFHLGMLRKEDEKALEKLESLKDRGVIRGIAASFHDRKTAAELAGKWPLDLIMIRYNAAHRGAETEFFPYVDNKKIPVVVFNATRHKSLLKSPRGWRGKVPSAGDCYRFALTNPKVTACLAGPETEQHVKEIFEAVEKGPMSEEEMKWMLEFGDRVYGRKPSQPSPQK
jgi:aryl-alcohol dehydrogenase-like predicted oxidoreductase